jgi:pimeloyl-ACP methyl ester carboxylesterase
METPLLLLHGALGSAAQFEALRAQLPDNQPVFALNFPGHGGTSATQPFSARLFADAILDFLNEKNCAQADIFGYSMGGYVALWLAWQRPERVSQVRTLGTKLDWSPEVAAGMSRMFDPEKIEAKAPALAQSLATQHGDWKLLCQRTAVFLRDLGEGKGIPATAFGEIRCPVRIGWGALDNVVSEAECLRAAAAIPRGAVETLPDVPHLLEQADVGQVADFLTRK